MGSKAEVSADAQQAAVGLKAFEVPRLPSEGFTSHYVDFEGKVQLLGYSMDNLAVARPGATLSLTLYWQRVGSLGEGWNLFTHILGERGAQLSQQDSAGPLRESSGGANQPFGPSQWQVGKIYKDELTLTIPRSTTLKSGAAPLEDERVSVAVGVWKGARTRLNVISGVSDKRHRAIVVDFSTGIARKQPVEAQAVEAQAVEAQADEQEKK
jgi:hypothetical protein